MLTDTIFMFIQLFIGRRMPQLNHEIAAAAVNDVFHLLIMEMGRCDLLFIDDQDLFRIGFSNPLLGLVEHPIANRDDGQADVLKIARAKIRDIPSQLVTDNLLALLAFGLQSFNVQCVKGGRRNRFVSPQNREIPA